MNLHGQIMNLPTTGEPAGGSMAYKLGHRDARHAAADLALKADAEREIFISALAAILPWLPKSSATDGGATRHSANVRGADMVRKALAIAAG